MIKMSVVYNISNYLFSFLLYLSFLFFFCFFSLQGQIFKLKTEKLKLLLRFVQRISQLKHATVTCENRNYISKQTFTRRAVKSVSQITLARSTVTVLQLRRNYLNWLAGRCPSATSFLCNLLRIQYSRGDHVVVSLKILHSPSFLYPCFSHLPSIFNHLPVVFTRVT